MKTKKTLIPIITLCAALSLTACSGSGSATTESSQKTQTEATTEAADNSNTKLDDLYQQENQIFADHADVWNKVFGMMNKSSADPSGDYADYLAGTVESNKESFTDDELKTLNDDIETIRQIKSRYPKSKIIIQDQKAPTRTTVPKKSHLSRVSPVRISMVILLTKACFPIMQ